MSTPVNRLGASVHRTLVIDCLENLNISCIVIVDVSEIRVIPLTQHTKALKALTLGIYLLNRHLAAELTDLLGRQLIELLCAKHLLNLVLDWLTMAVPTRNIRSLEALHSLIAVDDVLGNLILCVTQVNWTICIRRSIMKDKLIVSLVLLHQELIDVVLVPISQTLRLVLRK